MVDSGLKLIICILTGNLDLYGSRDALKATKKNLDAINFDGVSVAIMFWNTSHRCDMQFDVRRVLSTLMRMESGM